MADQDNHRVPFRTVARQGAIVPLRAPLSPPQRAAAAEIEQTVERAKREPRSQQPRFYATTDRAFTALSQWLQLADLEEPPYKVDTRKRDEWLRAFWMREAHLSGVMDSVVAIDKNRGWTLIGARRQVTRYRNMLLFEVEGGAGWRTYCSMSSLAWYSSDLGSITEIERDGDSGPTRNLYTVDPARCRVTGNALYPLKYSPTDPDIDVPKAARRGRPSKSKRFNPRYDIELAPTDFFRAVSMPSTDERMYRVGLSAVSRCIQFAKMMYAVFAHDQEMLGAKMPRGILLLNNIDEEQWDNALRTRQAQQEGLGQRWFGNVMILASASMDQAEIKLTALSQLPNEFERKEFVAYTMAGIALCFGFDPAEFWPVETGGLGRSEETKAQHRKASGKGARDFALAHQQGIQSALARAPGLTFEYEERDAEGLQFDANLAKTRTEIITKIYATKSGSGAETRPLLSWEETRMLLADSGIMPVEWTESINDATADDAHPSRMRELRQQLIERERVRAACLQFPTEPIVRYNSRTDSYATLWSSGADALRRHSFPGASLSPVPIAAPDLITHMRSALASAADGYLSGSLSFAAARRSFMATLDDGWLRAAELARLASCSPTDPDDLAALIGADLEAAEHFWDSLIRTRALDPDSHAVAHTRAACYSTAVQQWLTTALEAV